MQPHTGNARAPGWVERIENEERLESLSDPVQRGLRKAFGKPAGRSLWSFLRGDWMGHPLHPALTDIPIGTWTAATIFDVASLLGYRHLATAARASVAVGVAGAVGAAITGLADWAGTEGRSQRVGVVHAGLNSLALGLQIASLARRYSGTGSGRLLSGLALVVAGASAYLGGKLVYQLGTRVAARREAGAYSGRAMGEPYGAHLPGDLQ
ncbi:MAG: DUF2231 domain-containing protein [Pseudomonadota bacterium]|nr:MAG: hypothetical protein DIU72_00625 [Pseudomonadota bacterium]